MKKNSLIISWCTDKSKIDEYINFFVSNVDNIYISHGEYQCGRSKDMEHWGGNLKSSLHEEFLHIIQPDKNNTCLKRIALASVDDKLVGLFIVYIVSEIENSYAIIEDMIVEKSRQNQGIGSVMLSWLEDELREMDIQMIFLESGIRNKNAHFFFEKSGFFICSYVMAKNIRNSLTD